MSTSVISQSLAGAGQTPAASRPLLDIRAIAKKFGNQSVLRDISLQIADGDFLTILGESGSGKTTLLRIIAGFETADSGEVWMGGERLDQLPPYRRRVNTVFQNYALFPHLTVEQNVGYGLRVSKVASAELTKRVDEALAMVKMTGFARSKPSRISGGQQQRVALARALVNRPQLLLLDEPLSALDANLRRQMQMELKALQREVGITFVFVTHDQEEAMVMSDRIALLRGGALEQVGAPREIYTHPATSYAAQFIGRTNLLRAEVKQGVASWGPIAWPTPLPDGPAIFSLRPECIRLQDKSRASADAVRFSGSLLHSAFHGATELQKYILHAPDGNQQAATGFELWVRRASEGGNSVAPGSAARVPCGLEFFSADAVPVRDSGN